MSDAADNMRIWDRVCRTDPDMTKPVDQRGGFTAIDAQYQLERATEIFGPLGEGWGYIATHSTFGVADTVLCFSDVVLWHGKRENCFGPSRGCNVLVNAKGHLDEDAPKKATTDAIKKLLSQLGFSADVFLGLFDDERYVEKRRKEVVADREKNAHSNMVATLRAQLKDIGCNSIEDADIVVRWAVSDFDTMEQVKSTEGAPARVLSALLRARKEQRLTSANMLEAAKAGAR